MYTQKVEVSIAIVDDSITITQDIDCGHQLNLM